jgi:hypothetical protein
MHCVTPERWSYPFESGRHLLLFKCYFHFRCLQKHRVAVEMSFLAVVQAKTSPVTARNRNSSRYFRFLITMVRRTKTQKKRINLTPKSDCLCSNVKKLVKKYRYRYCKSNAATVTVAQRYRS